MVSHNWDHGDAGLRNLKSEFGVETPVEWIQCELGNLEEVRKVFSDIRKNEDRLDIVRLASSHRSFPGVCGLIGNGILYLVGSFRGHQQQ